MMMTENTGKVGTEGGAEVNNERIRRELKVVGMKQWQLAELMGISEQTICRKFRKELPEDEQQRIIELIQNSTYRKEV
jgi:DNA-binding XRE family transcriptional regulator